MALAKPVTADLSGTYTVHAVLTPVVGSTSSTDWSSLIVGNSSGGTGWVEGVDVALGVRVRADGAVQVFQGGTALLPTEATVPATGTYAVQIAAAHPTASGAPSQATVTVNGTRVFAGPTPAPLPRDGYVYLGSKPSTTGQAATVTDLRVSMLGGLDYYGYFDVMDPNSPNNGADHLSELAPWTNMNNFVNDDAATGFLDSCLPAACVVDVSQAFILNGQPVADPAGALAAVAAKIGSNLDKVAAIYMLDEPYYHGLNAGQVQAEVGQIQAAFPGKMIAYTTDAGHLGNQPPSGVDLVGFDNYCQGRGTVEQQLTTLENALPAQSDQHMVLFPESTNFSGQDGPNGCSTVSDATIAGNNADYRAIATQDPRVVSLENFRWINAQQATDMPLTTQEQQTLGKAVINATPGKPVSSVGVYRPSALSFYQDGHQGTGAPIGSATLGSNADNVPLTGHWTGPGRDTVGYYQPDTQTFVLSGDGVTPTITAKYGNPGDIPLVGDWSGQGRDTIGVYRPSNQTFYLSNDNATPAYSIKYGNPGWTPLVGNWSGSGATTVGAYDPNTQMFYLCNSNNSGSADHTFKFGNPGDIPVKGDWDGSGTDTVGVYRPSTQSFYAAAKDSNLVIYAAGFGNPGDVPLVGTWG